ncbi:MAG: hypothetical protein ACI9ZF_001841 [Bradyrhizobium sp.]|jgi:hypothetical protein
MPAFDDAHSPCRESAGFGACHVGSNNRMAGSLQTYRFIAAR